MCTGQNRALHWSNHYTVRPGRRDEIRLRALLSAAEALAGQPGMTTHEAKDFLRSNGHRASAHRIHVLLRRLACRRAGAGPQAFASLAS